MIVQTKTMDTKVVCMATKTILGFGAWQQKQFLALGNDRNTVFVS